jgi:hexosaminidase
MNIKKYIFAVAAACVGVSAIAAAKAPIAVKWEMGINEFKPGFCSTQFTIRNISGSTLNSDWDFYYNMFSRAITTPDGSTVEVKEIAPNYYRIKPNGLYKPLAAGDSLKVTVLMEGTFRSICYGPGGGHFAFNGSTDVPIPVQIFIPVMNDPRQWTVPGHELVNYPDGKFMYDFNGQINPVGTEYTGNAYNVFPTPKSIRLTSGIVTFPSSVSISAKDALSNAENYLSEKLENCGISVSKRARMNISLQILPNNVQNPEYYEMRVVAGKIIIAGSTETGVLNGVKTLVAVVERGGGAGTKMPEAVITDYPDFHYRGMSVDIARNFTKAADLKKLIDVLGSLKINTFQLHFTDDEAWRLEISGIPELTQVGSRKGLTNDEKEFLIQTYAGNGNPNDTTTSANGYISRAQFIDIIKYAASHGVEIIPEIESPGHARAAIVSLKARYNKLIATNPAEANRYRVWDLNDKSDFTSSQGYHDNILNVGEEGTYRFMEKVIDEIISMYAEAGVKLKTIHIGGDEVPEGAWSASPSIEALKAKEGIKTEHELAAYYLDRVSAYIASKGLKTGGWQEVAANHPDAFNKRVAPRINGVGVWSTMGSSDKVPYEIANSGYPVILSNVNNFYYDMVYSRHQYELGLNWGGAVSEFESWNAQPYNMYRSARYNYYTGKPFDLAKAADGKPALEKKENIIGVQGQLWAETIRNFPQVESYIFPKILGMVERGWDAVPDWGNDYTDFTRYNAERAQYNLKIGLEELPRLEKIGCNFHIGQPGIIVKDGQLLANSQYPGETIRYTLDGSEPTATSAEWTAPVPVPDSAKLIKAKAFYLGKESVTTYLFR